MWEGKLDSLKVMTLENPVHRLGRTLTEPLSEVNENGRILHRVVSCDLRVLQLADASRPPVVVP